MDLLAEDQTRNHVQVSKSPSAAVCSHPPVLVWLGFLQTRAVEKSLLPTPEPRCRYTGSALLPSRLFPAWAWTVCLRAFSAKSAKSSKTGCPPQRGQDAQKAFICRHHEHVNVSRRTYGQRKPSILASYPTAHSFLQGSRLKNPKYVALFSTVHDVHDFLEDGPHNHQLTILQE